MHYWLKGGLVGINEGETCPAGLGKEKYTPQFDLVSSDSAI